MEGWTCIYTSGKLIEVEIIRGYLDENNITAIIVNKQDSVYFIGDVELYVPFEDAFSANQIIKSIQQSE